MSIFRQRHVVTKADRPAHRCVHTVLGHAACHDQPFNLSRLEFGCQLSTPLQKFTNVFLSISTAELCKESSKIVTGEPPCEGTGGSFPIVLKIEEALGQGVAIGKVIGLSTLRWTIEK